MGAGGIAIALKLPRLTVGCAVASGTVTPLLAGAHGADGAGGAGGSSMMVGVVDSDTSALDPRLDTLVLGEAGGTTMKSSEILSLLEIESLDVPLAPFADIGIGFCRVNDCKDFHKSMSSVCAVGVRG
jgi:hypothetical protein